MSGRDFAMMTLISVAVMLPFLYYTRSIDKSLKLIAEGTYEEDYEEEYEGEIEEK
jgi:hypothetical protein